MTNVIQSRPYLTGALSLITLGSIAAYLTKRRLNTSCPRVPIHQLPTSSACRNLLDTGEEIANRSPIGIDKSVLLSTWPSTDRKTHWVPHFVALQVDIPISQLEKYDARKYGVEGDKPSTYQLSQKLFAAFLDARSRGPEAWVLDEPTPPSLTPGSLLFGKGNDIGAFMLGSWSSISKTPLESQNLPSAGPKPVTEFPSNKDAVFNCDTDTAGTVFYWRVPTGLINAVNSPASYGIPWRFMDGGFQEFIVERGPDDTARVSYVTIECSNLYPGGQRRDFKMMPRLLYELHVLYGQILLFKTLRQLG
ncbi:hypothetical protein ASPVEDRAFT_47500 [Aspergillus versicolor CBS 583.65]|uniref:Uncharacterized protein n=1 Tax=Aspergillus versicolor CBS 583.65 TaxID=1036611 RepID=A0A1L9Q3N7_ASPVE|nr:uncharacterized protein ASPVEDRAFT_47500 [Aspergillus versicolor CBS 583.65]OJJ08356.1 hypothetical protein ASPVEDRAFT_47500 [Aspergillus versicolor CBS 583.65]